MKPLCKKKILVNKSEIFNSQILISASKIQARSGSIANGVQHSTQLLSIIKCGCVNTVLVSLDALAGRLRDNVVDFIIPVLPKCSLESVSETVGRS